MTMTPEQVTAEVARYKARFAEVRATIEAEEAAKKAKLEAEADATEEARIAELVTQRIRSEAAGLPDQVAAVLQAEKDAAAKDAADKAAAAQPGFPATVQPAPATPTQAAIDARNAHVANLQSQTNPATNANYTAAEAEAATPAA
jgi:hypothetical protein